MNFMTHECCSGKSLEAAKDENKATTLLLHSHFTPFTSKPREQMDQRLVLCSPHRTSVRKMERIESETCFSFTEKQFSGLAYLNKTETGIGIRYATSSDTLFWCSGEAGLCVKLNWIASLVSSLCWYPCILCLSSKSLRVALYKSYYASVAKICEIV